MRHLLLSLLALSAPLYARAEDASPRLDQIQVIGSHNSYHAGLAPSIMALLERTAPDVARGLDYAHPPLPVQFVCRQDLWDEIGELNNGGFLAHRNDE